MKSSRMSLFATAAGIAAFALPLVAQELPIEGPVPTTALISVQSKTEQPLNTAALKLEVDGHAAQISSVVPVSAEGAQIAILVDDGLRGSFGLQIEELQHFIHSLPPNAQVMVGYMQNGTVRAANGFSSNHDTAVDSLRIPLSEPGISASPYFCLSEFVKHWPSRQPGARVVLMLTNGVDPYNGSVSPLNQDSPYVQTAQNDAQRAGVAVYSIYYGNAGIRGRGGLASFSGQSYLEQVAEATGALSLNQGTITPPSIAPYLNEVRHALGESYLVTFNASANREKTNTLTSIKLKTEQAGVKLRVPHAVHPGLAQQASE